MTQLKLPVISVLTPSYNQGMYVERTIASVLEQDYSHIEHIVMDGGSKDETISILKRYPHLKWVSERDRGQADSLNKGLRMATGDIVGWVNSDDFYARAVFQEVKEIFEDESVGWVVGDVVNYYDRSGREEYVYSESVSYKSLIRDPDILRQPGTFFRTSLLREIGGWDPELHMVMDLDLWLRLARIRSPRMLHRAVAYFRIHPEQKTRPAMHALQTGEIDRVLKRHGASIATRLQHRTRKRYWWAKGAIKGWLMSAGILDAEPV
jgi:glycosyltransferase involved in cell wall biosynthesis